MAISVLGSQFARQRQLPFMEDAWTGVEKIQSQLPSAIREELSITDGAMLVQAARVSPQAGCQQQFQTIRKAISNRRKVKCAYEDGKKNPNTPFLFWPYALFFSQRAWYVIGHHEIKNQERSLKLNRIRQVSLTDRPCCRPDGWSLQESMGNAWRMIRGKCRYEVVIRFDEKFGRTVADTLWHPTQTIAWESNGDCIFKCSVDGLDEILWWVLGYGPHARVLSPPELCVRVYDLSMRLVELYDDDLDPHISDFNRGRKKRSIGVAT